LRIPRSRIMLPAMRKPAPSRTTQWYRALAGAAVVSTALALGACRPPGQPPQPKAEAEAAARPPAEANAAAPARRAAGAVVFLGDSLTAGYGLSEEQAYPALLEARMREAGIDLPVVNAGVSGDTTAGGAARLDWTLRQEVAVLVVALGANDGLRGVPLEETRRNLSRIVERAQAAGARVVLAGMKLPTNYGPQYRAGFEQIYVDLARQHGVPPVPFLLEGVGGVPRLNQADGVHPTAEGQRVIADVVWPVLEPLLREAARRPA
jgi:acyl-CoA thioesterase-1